jgi:ATP-dependent Lon protease
MVCRNFGLESDEKETLVKKYEERLKDKVVPEAADKVIKEELAKLQTLEPSSSEYNVCRNYLDWLTVLPWGSYKEEKFNLP